MNKLLAHFKFPLSAYVDVAETDSESDISAHSKSVMVGSGSKTEPK